MSDSICALFFQEEWVVCRIFQKSSTVKKPQQITSSPHESMESAPCDTNTIATNELGDIELANFSNLAANSSSSNIIGISPVDVLNWNALREAANVLPQLTSSWPHNSTPTMSPNLLFRALQLRNIANTTDYNSLMIGASPQGINSHFGNDFITSSHIAAASGASSSSRVIIDHNSVQQPHQEQPFNLDSNIW